MSTALKWKLIVGFVLVFLAGGMTGAFFGASQARHFFFAQHHRSMLGERMRQRLRVELKLTPEQVTKISPLIDNATAQLEQIRIETGRRVHQTMTQMHRQMAANLTDEQRAKLERIESHHRPWRGFHEPPPRSPGEEPQE